jgi:hypothetical protein
MQPQVFLLQISHDELQHSERNAAVIVGAGRK